MAYVPAQPAFRNRIGFIGPFFVLKFQNVGPSSFTPGIVIIEKVCIDVASALPNVGVSKNSVSISATKVSKSVRVNRRGCNG